MTSLRWFRDTVQPNTLTTMELLGLWLGALSSYDPPCDAGFNCNLDDRTLSTGVMIWIVIIGGFVAMFLLTVMKDVATGGPQRRRRHVDELFARGFRGPMDQKPTHSRDTSWVSYLCPKCTSWVHADYEMTIGREPVDLCSRCNPPS